MKHESWLLLGLGFFFGLTALVYWLWSSEQSGSIMLLASLLLGLLPGSYFFWWSRRMRVRPSDSTDATIKEGSGFVETFPGSSIWPFILGSGAFFVGMALVFGTWLAVPAAGLVIWGMIGGVAESRRGTFDAHIPHHEPTHSPTTPS